MPIRQNLSQFGNPAYGNHCLAKSRIWCISPNFGILCQEKSGALMGGSLKYFPTRNLQTVSRQSMCPALESNLRGNKLFVSAQNPRCRAG
jgi:hypothetical protein